MRKELMNHLTFLAEMDERIWLLTGDLGYGYVDEFAEKYPDRFLNCGVAEQNMVGIAAGLAREGKIPFVYSMSNFITFRCAEQIRNDVSYPLLPVRFISIGGGYTYGAQGYTHHGLEDVAVMRAMPYMRIEVPTTNKELFELMCKATDTLSTFPMYIRVSRETYESQDDPGYEMGDLCEWDDFNVAILTYGDGYPKALEVAEGLRTRGITVAVETARTLRPFTHTSLFRYKTPVVVIEEHSEFGGLASEYLDMLSSKGGRCLVYGLPPVHVAASREEYMDAVWNTEQMVGEIEEWVKNYDNE